MDIRMAICEDNSIFAEKVKNICKEYFAVINENCQIEIFPSGEEFLKTDWLSWDILFLDIEMGEMSGIEVKNRLKDMENSI